MHCGKRPQTAMIPTPQKQNHLSLSHSPPETRLRTAMIPQTPHPQDCALAGRACAQGSCASEARSVMPQIDNFRAAGLFAQHRGGVVLVFDTFDKASLSRAWENEGASASHTLPANRHRSRGILMPRSANEQARLYRRSSARGCKPRGRHCGRGAAAGWKWMSCFPDPA